MTALAEPAEGPTQSAVLLGGIAAVAAEIGVAAVADEARSLMQRAAEGRFFVACVGQFKRGKSTVLNALTGTDALPTGVVPVTSVPTVIRYGEPRAQVRHAGGTWTDVPIDSLADYVSEDRNPGNAKGVQAVEVFLQSDLLAHGLCFVDTPGISSVFAANTEATRDFVPHVDAALVVLGADPPISGEEMGLVAEIASNVSTFVFTLNKTDRVTAREAGEAAEFTRKVLSKRLGRAIKDVYCISAVEVREKGKPTRDWQTLVDQLQALAAESSEELVAGAVRRGIARLAQRLRGILCEQEAALTRPVEESEVRLQALRQAAAESRQSIQDLDPLFAAEERRLGNTFAARRSAFFKESWPQAIAELGRRLCESKRRGPALRDEAFAIALQVAQEQISPFLSESERAADEAFRSAAQRFTRHADELLARLRESAAWGSAPLPDDIGDEGLHADRRFFFHTFHHLSSPSGLMPVLVWLADLLLPRALALRGIEGSAREYLYRVLETNAARVENDLLQRLRESRVFLERRIQAVLTGALATVEDAMERARAAQEGGAAAVERELSRLQDLLARLDRALGQTLTST